MAAGEGGGALDPPVRSARIRATWTIVLVGLCSAVAFVDAVQQALRLIQVNRLASSCIAALDRDCRHLDIAPSLSALDRLDARVEALLIVQGVVLLIAGVVWLTWQHRAQRLLHERLVAPGLRFTPGWAVGWWFVPFANLGMPVVTMAELWRASGGDDGPMGQWRDRRLPALLGWWWAMWLAGAGFGYSSRGLANDGDATLTTIRVNGLLLTVGALAVVVSGVLAVAVVYRIQSRLERATPYGRAARSASSALPWAPGGVSGQPAGAQPEPAGAPWLPPPPPLPGARVPAGAETASTPEAGAEPGLPPLRPATPAIPGPALPPAPGFGSPVGEPPTWNVVRVTAVLAVVVAVVGSFLVAATSPTVRFIEETAAAPTTAPATTDASASPGATASSPAASSSPGVAGWTEHGDATLGFVIQAPPDWDEILAKTGVLNLRGQDIPGLCTIGHQHVPEAVSLDAVVAGSVAELRKAKDIHIQGAITTEPLTLPAGPSELVRFHATLRDHQGTFLQYYLIESNRAWVLSFAGSVDQEFLLAPLADQISRTFRFVD